jgi:transglutaminase-like putative cysteine protease
MRLIIKHMTRYVYSTPVMRLAQSVRLHPTSNNCQQIIRWQVLGSEGMPLAATADGFGNINQLHHPRNPGNIISLTVDGEVETVDTHGVVKLAYEPLPSLFFTAHTPYTQPDAAILSLAHDISATTNDRLQQLHNLMEIIRARIDYRVDVTDVEHTAAQALAQGSGVCQDHAHVMIAAARALDIPARYVSGYLWTHDTTDHVASHAWMEALVPDIGWIGFDAANLVCPDDRYVRLAYGRDYADAAPVRGVRIGGAQETLDVSVQVRTVDQQ